MWRRWTHVPRVYEICSERGKTQQEKVLGTVLIRTKWILDSVTSAMELVILLRNVQQKTRSIQDIMLGIL